jgi:N-acetylglucosaminyldiphosphoundecaprenol N-acetyl-beta-D-mannosaminyltransferase
MLQHSQTFSSLLIGVGAAFDFHAGAKRRAPRWMQRSGLEWLHRLSSEPRRLGPRYVSTNVEFVARAGAEVARCRVRERSGRCRSR